MADYQCGLCYSLLILLNAKIYIHRIINTVDNTLAFEMTYLEYS